MNGTAAELKRKIMLRLANDEEIFRLIDNKNIDPDEPDNLIYNNIFPFKRIDYTVQEVGSYICVGLDYPKINHNEIFKNASLTFIVVCNTNAMKVDGGYARTDAIAERIIELFDWTTDLGFRIELSYEDEDAIDENFYFRRVVFTSFSPNGMKDGKKIN